MGIYKRGQVWWMAVSVGGRQYRETTGTKVKRLAEEKWAKRRNEVFEGRHFPEKKKTGLTVAGLRDLWLEKAEGKKTLDDDRRRFGTLVELLGEHTPVAALTVHDIEKLKATLRKRRTKRSKKPLRPATVNRHLALLKSALRYAARVGYQHQDPLDGVAFLEEKNKRDRICTPDEYQQLIGAASAKLRLAIVLGYWSGMRLGEIASLTWDNIDVKKGIARLRADDTKTSEARTVPLSREVIDELKHWPRSLDGRLLDVDRRTLSPAFTRLCRGLEIKDLRFHDLRHTAATRLRRAGADIFTIAEITGHRDLASLQRYNTVTVEDKRNAMIRAEEMESG